MEKVTLRFYPGGQEGYKWASGYGGMLVGLCRKEGCEFCNQEAREDLRGFRGGKIEVMLERWRKPSFWKEEYFYSGHLVSVPEEEVEVDQGLEVDVSELNAILLRTSQGTLLIDPGATGFNGDDLPFRQLIAGQQIRAAILTHGHLDHMSLVGLVDAPAYMSRLTYRLLDRHAFVQQDYRLVRALEQARMVVPGESILLEELPLRVETIPLPHSIPETMGLVIRGEKKRVVHLGDFKFTGMEARSKAETIAALRQVAEGRVDLLCLNIINAHIGGFTLMGGLVINTFTDILTEAEGRVIITCFSSNLERIQRISEIAQLLGRPVAFCGAGMRNSQEILGIETKEEAIDSERAVVFVTGCQAEEDSVLWRIAQGRKIPEEKRPKLKLRPEGDILTFSARCIPGNEDDLHQLMTVLRPQVKKMIVSEGEIAQVGLANLDIEETLTHITGHGSQEDLRLALEILQPKSVLAWPHFSPQIEAFRQIAESLGIGILDEKERIIEI